MFEDSDSAALFGQKNCKAAISSRLTAWHMLSVNCVFEIFAGPSQLWEDVLNPIACSQYAPATSCNWNVYQTKCGSRCENPAGPIIGKELLTGYVWKLQKFGGPFLLRMSFIDKYIVRITINERKIVRPASHPYQSLPCRTQKANWQKDYNTTPSHNVIAQKEFSEEPVRAALAVILDHLYKTSNLVATNAKSAVRVDAFTTFEHRF